MIHKLFKKFHYQCFCMITLYLGFNPSWAAPQDSSLETIKTLKRIRVAADIYTMPWYGYDPTNAQFIGFEYEFLETIVKAISPDIEIKIIPANWETLPNLVKEKRADIVFSAWVPRRNRSDENWGKCYFYGGLSVLYPAHQKEPSTQDLQKGKVMVYPNEDSIEILKKLNITHVLKNDEDTEYDHVVLTKLADFVIYDSIALQWLAQKNPKVKTTKIIPGSEFCYAPLFRNDANALKNAFEKAIDATEEQRKEILKKYGLSH